MMTIYLYCLSPKRYSLMVCRHLLYPLSMMTFRSKFNLTSPYTKIAHLQALTAHPLNNSTMIHPTMFPMIRDGTNSFVGESSSKVKVFER